VTAAVKVGITITGIQAALG